MKDSLRTPRPSGLVVLRVEMRIISELDSLSSEKLSTIEQAIVASTLNVCTSTTRRTPTVELISHLDLYSPVFKSETRYSLEVLSSSPSIETNKD